MNIQGTSLRFLRLPAVEVRTGLKRTRLFSLGRDGAFPKPVNISGESLWLESEVDGFIEASILLASRGEL